MSIFRYIGFSYNDVSNSCAMFGEQDTTSTGPGVNTKIFSVPPFDCLKDDQCKDKKFPYCVDMQCSPCPKEWTSNEDFTFCYKHFDEKKRFQDARTSCQAAAPATRRGTWPQCRTRTPGSCSLPSPHTRHGWMGHCLLVGIVLV